MTIPSGPEEPTPEPPEHLPETLPGGDLEPPPEEGSAIHGKPITRQLEPAQDEKKRTLEGTYHPFEPFRRPPDSPEHPANLLARQKQEQQAARRDAEKAAVNAIINQNQTEPVEPYPNDNLMGGTTAVTPQFSTAAQQQAATFEQQTGRPMKFSDKNAQTVAEQDILASAQKGATTKDKALRLLSNLRRRFGGK